MYQCENCKYWWFSQESAERCCSPAGIYLTPDSEPLAAAFKTSPLTDGFGTTLGRLTGVTGDAIKLVGAADLQTQGITARVSSLRVSFRSTEIVSGVSKPAETDRLLQLTAPAFTGGLGRESYQTGDMVRLTGLAIPDEWKINLDGSVSVPKLTGPTIPDQWGVNPDGSVPLHRLRSALPSRLHYHDPDGDPLYITVKPAAGVHEPIITGLHLPSSALIVGHPTTWQPEPGIRTAQADALLKIEPLKPFYTAGQNILSYGEPAHELLYVPGPAPLPPAKRLPPPTNGNSGIPPAQPVQPADWRAALAADLRAGRAKPGDVLKLVAQVITLPPVETLRAELRGIEPLEQAWQRVKGRKTVERFAADHGMSRATLYRRWDRLKELRLLLEVWQ